MKPDTEKATAGTFDEELTPIARPVRGLPAPHRGHLYAPLVCDRTVCPTNWSNTLAGDLATMPDIVLESETSLHEAMEALSDFIGITVPVVDNRHHMKLLGIIFENSVISAYNEAVEQARNEERGLA